ncbi:MAG: ribonuclease Z [Thermoplasmatota archaeon]
MGAPASLGLPMHENMEVVFLGTSASWPTIERNVAAVAVRRGREIILFDCGEGTQRQFQRSGLSYMQVSRILITHLHADHFLGIPGLIQTMRLNERREPLYVYGPPGIRELMNVFTAIGRARGGFAIKVAELSDGEEVRCDGYTIAARAIVHNTTAYAYSVTEEPRPGRFHKETALALGVPEGRLFGQLQRGEEVVTPAGRIVAPADVLGPSRAGRKVVYTGDCVPCEGTVEIGRGADVLIHDSTYAQDFAEANAYGHSTSAQAAFIARKAGVRRLFLTHISPRYTDATKLVEEARAIFPESYEARDLLEFVVRFPPDPTDTPAESAPAAAEQAARADRPDARRAPSPAQPTPVPTAAPTSIEPAVGQGKTREQAPPASPSERRKGRAGRSVAARAPSTTGRPRR